MISKNALEEFKAIWRKEFGEDISDGEATKQGINLLTLFNAVYRPLKKEWVNDKNTDKRDGSTPPNLLTL